VQLKLEKTYFKTKMQHLRLRLAHAVTLLPTGGIAFVKHACRCFVRSARVNSGSDFNITASQAYSERVFSVYGDLTAGKRNRMTRGLERRVFLRLKLKYV